MGLQYSFIIPVYNRPDEIGELLESLKNLSYEDSFEVVIVEDGSELSSQEVVESYKGDLNILYLEKENTGPGHSRNFGMAEAHGNYFVILDSDCILPNSYLQNLDSSLTETYVDCFGGPDAAHDTFSNIQKAINFSMTSFMTTGGIRGNKNAINKFQPRSFNMGISKAAFLKTGGFGNIHPGEDPDLALRILKEGFSTRLIPQVFVYHKRRISWKTFYQQISKFGMVRPILNNWHPGSAKATYWFPVIFSIGLLISLGLLYFDVWLGILLYSLYFVMVCIIATAKNKSFRVGVLAIVATCIQLLGYGYGFFISMIKLHLLKRQPEVAFPHLFFKN